MNTVYFLQVTPDGPIKIGFTTGNVAVRIKALQQASPYELRWIGSFKGKVTDERNAHKRLAKFRLRGEWFHPTQEVRDFVKEKCPDFSVQSTLDALFFGKERLAVLSVLRPHDKYRTIKAEMIGKVAQMPTHDIHRWLNQMWAPSRRQAERAAKAAIRLGAL